MANAERARRLDVAGTTNFRDLGGYKTQDGRRQTKWGLVYRSDALNLVSAATAEERIRDGLHIHHVFDLRKDSELKAKPYDFPGIEHHYVPSDASLMGDWGRSGKPFTAQITFDLMLQNYRDRIDNYAAPYRAIFRFLIDTVCATELRRATGAAEAREAVLFHCTAGKDRTGWMAALLLSALQVPFDTILGDFMLTNQYLVRPADAVNYMGGLGMDEESMNVLWTVDPRYLTSAFDYVNTSYGGVEAYLEQKVGLSGQDIETLRAALLE